MTLALDLLIFVDALDFVRDERALVLRKTWEHLVLSAAALGIALLVALPVGVGLGHLHRGSFLAVNVANLGRENIQQRLNTAGLERFGLQIPLLPLGGSGGFLLGT